MLPSAYGLGQYFQDLRHSFSPYGPPSRQIIYISSKDMIDMFRVKRLRMFDDVAFTFKSITMSKGRDETLSKH